MALSESFTPFLTEIRVNPRLRLGLWLIIGIAWIYCLLLLRDEVQRATNEHQAFAKKVARTLAQAGQNEWLERAESAQAAQLQHESRLWREGTIGLAQASFQDWLNLAMQQSGLTKPVVTVAAQEESASEKSAAGAKATDAGSNLWKVTAKLNFDFTPKNLYELMGRLVGHERQIVVETLVIRSVPAPRAEMLVVAYFQKPAESLKAAGNK